MSVPCSRTCNEMGHAVCSRGIESVARVCRPHGEYVNEMLFGSIYILIFDRHELSIQDAHLSIADCEKMAFHISRARCLSIDLKEHTVVSVYKLDAAAVHCCVRYGTKVDKQPKIVVCIESIVKAILLGTCLSIAATSGHRSCASVPLL